MPGFSVREIDPPPEESAAAYGLEVTFPPHIVSHCTHSAALLRPDFLLRRHDYEVTITGALRGASM